MGQTNKDIWINGNDVGKYLPNVTHANAGLNLSHIYLSLDSWNRLQMLTAIFYHILIIFLNRISII